MNIKSLLLGSAAALVAVSGAQAADAVVAAEPEPMEYVKVCDAYGTGYFYIPGTETCLKVGGRVRFDVNFKDQHWSQYAYHQAKGYQFHTRAELYLNSASDTEYGALKTNITARWDEGQSGIYDEHNPSLIAANIQLAGFTVGEADSLFSTFTGYAGNVDNDDIIPYGDFEVDQISYLYDPGTGFRAAIGLQDDHGTGGVGGLPLSNDKHGPSYYPDVIAGVGFNGGAFSANVVGGYDTSMEEGAVKARVDGKFGMFSAFVMGGWSSNKHGNAFSYDDGTEVAWGDWAVWTGATANLADNLSANLQASFDDYKTWAIVGNVQWYPVKDLLIQPEIRYAHFDSDAYGKGFNFDGRANGKDINTWSGMLRFQRTF